MGELNSVGNHLVMKYTFLTALLIVSLSILWLLNTDQLSQLVEYFLGDIFRQNAEFLKGTEHRASSMSLILSELHAGLLVLQSSEFGINFFLEANIKLGNVIAQLTELVAYGRNFALFNLITLHIIENLLQLVMWLSPWLIIIVEIGIITIVISEIWLPASNRWHMSLIRFGENVILLVLLVLIIFPLSVNIVSKSSKVVTEALHHESYQAVSDTRDHLLHGVGDKDLESSANNSLSQFKRVKANLPEKSSYLASHLTRYAAVTLLDMFILPFLFGILMFWCFRSLLKRHRHWHV